jgi:hypothetical protein
VCVCDWMGGCVIVNLVRVCVSVCARACMFLCICVFCTRVIMLFLSAASQFLQLLVAVFGHEHP